RDARHRGRFGGKLLDAQCRRVHTETAKRKWKWKKPAAQLRAAPEKGTQAKAPGGTVSREQPESAWSKVKHVIRPDFMSLVPCSCSVKITGFCSGTGAFNDLRLSALNPVHSIIHTTRRRCYTKPRIAYRTSR